MTIRMQSVTTTSNLGRNKAIECSNCHERFTTVTFDANGKPVCANCAGPRGEPLIQPADIGAGDAEVAKHMFEFVNEVIR